MSYLEKLCAVLHFLVRITRYLIVVLYSIELNTISFCHALCTLTYGYIAAVVIGGFIP